MRNLTIEKARARVGAATLATLLALTGCGGGGGGSVANVSVTPAAPPASAASSPVGPDQTAAVTITGPNGAAVVMPAGAASAPVAIVVAQADASAPALPASAVAASSTYEITPHGQAFDKAVDVGVPFDTTSIAAGERPILLKAEPGGQWMAITDVRVDGGMLHALVADFSYFAVVSCGSYEITTCAATPAIALKIAAPTISSAASAVLSPPPAGSASDLAAVAERNGVVHLEMQVTVPAGCLETQANLFLSLFMNVPDLIGISDEPESRGLHRILTLAYTGTDDNFVARRSRTIGSKSVVDLTAFFPFDVGTNLAGHDFIFAASATCQLSETHGVAVVSAPLRLTGDKPSLFANRRTFGIQEAPSDQTVAVGQTAIFFVSATQLEGSEYQWERSDDGGASWVVIPGENRSRYELKNARLDDNGARFRVIVNQGDALDPIVTFISDSAVLTVSPATVVSAVEVPWQADSLIAAGGSASFAVRNDHSLLSWGANNGGVLGRATAADGSPQPVDLADVHAIASGAWYAVALVGSGDVYAWGWGSNVGAAIGSTSLDNPAPTKVVGLADIRAIATRYQHTLALATNGDVYGFGPESFGGLGPTIGNDGVRQIAGLSAIRQVAAGEQHSLALASDGSVWAWGANGAGQIGVATTGPVQATPVQVPGLTDVVAIATSSFASFALRRDGTVWSWGQATIIGRTGDPGTPQQIPGLAGVASLGAGNYNAFAVDASGHAWGWGDNLSGRVGVGSTAATIDVPTTLPIPSGFLGARQVIGGETLGLALAGNGHVLAWGSNAFGGLGGPVSGAARPDANQPEDTGVTQ